MDNSNNKTDLAPSKWGAIVAASLIALCVGLILGYLFFSKMPAQSSDKSNEHQHDASQAPQTGNSPAETWTCSMHPQIRQNEPGICPICEMDLIPVESGNSNDPLVLQMTEEAVKLANIETSTIGIASGKTGKVIRLTGKVQSDERNASSQVTHVAGRIEKLYINFTGEEVYAGQQLADIYAPELIAAQQELLEALKIQEFSPDLPEAVRQKLRYWKISDATISRIENTGKIQETFPIFSAENGIVSKRRVAVGDYIKQGESLFDLMNLDNVWIIFDAYEEDLSEIRIGDRISFTASTIPNRTFKTNVTFIDPLVNPETRTVSIRTELSNENGLLKPGTLVYGELNKVRLMKGQLTVPKTAVMWTGKTSVVYVKLPESEIPSFQFREIELGEAIGNSYQILEGLKKGEEVVTYGNFTIDAAAQLNNQASMMNRNVSLKKEESLGVPNYQKVTPDAFKTQLNDLVITYLVLKDALVQTDADNATSAAEKFLPKLEAIDMKLLSGEAHVLWMKQSNIMLKRAKKIAISNDIEHQRVQFGFISNALITAIAAFGTQNKELYVQHCPMAFENEGADWLSDEEAIRNPYYGDKMMKCGLVKKQF